MADQNQNAVAQTDGKGSGIGAGAIVSIVGVAVLALFMLQNTESVTLSFLFWNFTWPLWLYGLIMAVIGAMVWFGAGVLRRHRRRKDRRDKR